GTSLVDNDGSTPPPAADADAPPADDPGGNGNGIPLADGPGGGSGNTNFSGISVTGGVGSTASIGGVPLGTILSNNPAEQMGIDSTHAATRAAINKAKKDRAKFLKFFGKSHLAK